MTRLRTHIIIAAGFLCLFMMPHGAFASCTLNVTQTAALDFTGGGTGTLAIQNSSTGVDTANTVSGATRIYGSAPVHGAFTVTDNGACGGGTITITLTDTGGAAGVTLSWPTNAFLKYNGTTPFANGATLPNPVNSQLLVGATATYNGVTAGTKSPTFNIHVAEGANTKDLSSTASIKFDTGLTVTPVSQISLGSVKAGIAATYTIDTTGATSTVGGVFEAATPTTVGQLTISGSSTQGLTISVGNLQPSNNVTITAERGQYGLGAANQTFPMTVTPPGAGTTLKLGVTVNASGSQTDTTVATPTFDVTVVYQ